MSDYARPERLRAAERYVPTSIYSEALDRIEELEQAICAVSHYRAWMGEKENPGWCLGCGKHRSLIREAGAREEGE